jgi:hypothetical protein
VGANDSSLKSYSDAANRQRTTCLYYPVVFLLVIAYYYSIYRCIAGDRLLLAGLCRRVMAGPGRVHTGFVIQMTTKRHVFFGHVVL